MMEKQGEKDEHWWQDIIKWTKIYEILWWHDDNATT